MNRHTLLRGVFAFGLALALAFGAIDAHAKRLGSGKSFGRQNSTLTTQRDAALTQQAAPAPVRQPGAASPQRQPGRWGGILGGLAAGLGLAALFHALGMAPGLSSVLGSMLMVALLALAAFWVIGLLRRKAGRQPTEPLRYATAPGQGYDTSALGVESRMPAQWTPASLPASAAVGGIPADFDRDAFLASAKQHYLRLQQAWDAADLDSLGTFTTPDMFDALAGELKARGMAPNKTEVVTLEAALLDLKETADDYLASVEFSGLVREETWGGASPVREIWNLVKPRDGSTGWLLAGIQQLN